MRHTSVDVLIATDLRFPGGNNASVVEEVKAQRRAGYTTALMHLPSPVQRSQRPYAPRIRDLIERGIAHLVLNEAVKTRLLVIRHPTVLMPSPASLANVSAENVLIVANQVPVDDRAREPYYDVRRCTRVAEKLTGRTPEWAPIGPSVRSALQPYARDIKLRPHDWNNIIDVDAWRVERSGFVADPPVIGRHSRGDWSKWPDTKEAILAAYPVDGSYTVKILGGVEAPTEILGELPDSWVDLPFNSIPPQQYLKQIDFLVYYHHPGLIEAFGRTILEGLAAGAVAIVDPSFETIFGPACLYSPIQRVRHKLDQMHHDVEAFLQQSRRGVAYVEEHFSYQTHQHRISEIIGYPTGPQSTQDYTPITSKHGKEENTQILVDPYGVFDAWDELSEKTVVLVADPYRKRVPKSLPVETIPARIVTQSGLMARYLQARVEGLLRVFPSAEVTDVGGMLGETRLPAHGRKRGGLGGRMISQLRQNAPARFVTLASMAKQAPRRIRDKAIDILAPSGAAVFKPSAFPRLRTKGPGYALFVSTVDIEDAEAVCRLIAQRAAVSNAFTPALLAPSSWTDGANQRGIPVESLLTQDEVLYLGGDWDAYCRNRILEAIQVFQPISVNQMGENISEQTYRALDIAENMGLQRSEGKG